MLVGLYNNEETNKEANSQKPFLETTSLDNSSSGSVAELLGEIALTYVSPNSVATGKRRKKPLNNSYFYLLCYLKVKLFQSFYYECSAVIFVHALYCKLLGDYYYT
jgi:hypothetical protein